MSAEQAGFDIVRDEYGYEYDVFLSYPAKYPFKDWVDTIFKPQFEFCLHEALTAPKSAPRVFYDVNSILAGDTFDERIRRALARSRCLVGIWCTAYFYSQWCSAECQAMMARETALGFRTSENPNGLVLPVVVFDGQNFPSFTQRIQHFDCRDYFFLGEGFIKSDRFFNFQENLRRWVRQVARAVENAPPCQDHWINDVKLPDPMLPPRSISPFFT